MEFTNFTAGPDDAGRRLDRVLKNMLKDRELNIYELMRKKLIRLNDKKAEPQIKVLEGDRIGIASFMLNQDSSETFNSQEIIKDLFSVKENILFENSHILILNKPKGINVQPAEKNEAALSTFVSEYLSENKNKSLSFSPAPLHRLDKYTTGAIAFGKTLACSRWFSLLIKNHVIEKTYFSIAEGHIPSKIEWNDFILEQNKSGSGGPFRTVEVYDKEVYGAKKAVTVVNPLQEFIFGKTELTFAEYKILTGRKHQIRAQSAFHGFPLYHDTAYGSENKGMFFLHAASLVFPQNEFDIPCTVKAPLPDDFKDFLSSNLINKEWDFII